MDTANISHELRQREGARTRACIDGDALLLLPLPPPPPPLLFDEEEPELELRVWRRLVGEVAVFASRREEDEAPSSAVALGLLQRNQRTKEILSLTIHKNVGKFFPEI